jgi:WXG100 family type VII secretion target
MTQFTVTPQELVTAAKTCQNTNGEIQTQVQQVVNFVNSLVDSGYQGPCASQLVNVSNQWRADATNLNAVLNEIAGNLITNANNYSGGESQNMNNVIAVGTTMPGNF